MKPRARLAGRIILSLTTGYALGCFLMAIIEPLLARPYDNTTVWLLLGLLSVVAGLALYLPGHKDHGRDRLLMVTRWCYLVLLPAWGFYINWTLPHCEACRAEPNRALVTPDVIGLYLLYAASLVAYAVSRRQQRRLRLAAEWWLAAFLGAGIILCLALAIHFGMATLYGVIFGPIGLPLVAPIVVIVYYTSELVVRLTRPGEGQGASGPASLALGSAMVLSVWTILQHLFSGNWPWEMFTRTCDWTLSQMHPPPADCHYLCTVAAQGSPWLVRPLRPGRRHGRAIVVNRQLCVANAFEDLLQTRWPRFGRLCRKVYDRLGLPVSRFLCRRWLANLVYLAMKPAEWVFGICLLLLDREDPEERIGRMYR